MKNYKKNFILKENLKKFMGVKISNRREILEKLWNYIKKNDLMDKNLIALD